MVETRIHRMHISSLYLIRPRHLTCHRNADLIAIGPPYQKRICQGGFREENKRTEDAYLREYYRGADGEWLKTLIEEYHIQILTNV